MHHNDGNHFRWWIGVILWQRDIILLPQEFISRDRNNLDTMILWPQGNVGHAMQKCVLVHMRTAKAQIRVYIRKQNHWILKNISMESIYRDDTFETLRMCRMTWIRIFCAFSKALFSLEADHVTLDQDKLLLSTPMSLLSTPILEFVIAADWCNAVFNWLLKVNGRRRSSIDSFKWMETDNLPLTV